MSKRRQWTASLTAIALTATIALAPATPVGADAPGTTAWSGNGAATAGPATNTRVVADGVGESAVFAYDNLVRAAGGPAAANWEFATTATGAGSVSLDYLYEGFHAFFQVNVSLEAFVTDGVNETTTTLVADGPVNCCTAPSGGFEYTGSHTFAVQAGETFGFRMSGSNGDNNGQMSGRLIVGAPGTVHADTIVLNGYDTARTDGDWGLTEPYFLTVRNYLNDPDGFGPSGKSPTDYVVADGIDVASATSLIGTDAFLTGWIPTGTYTVAEKQALVDFVTAGGSLIATTDDTGHTVVDAFGLQQLDGTTNPSTFLDAAHPIADGPFGTDTQFIEYATQGSYLGLGPNAVAVAADAAGNTTIAEILPGSLGPGSGLALFLSDVDFFTDIYGGAQDNELLIGNLFDYVADSRGPATPAEVGSAQLIQAVPAANGDPVVAVAAQVVGPANSTQDVTLVTSSTCVDGQIDGPVDIGSFSVPVGPEGEAFFADAVPVSSPVDSYAALRVDGGATPTAASACVIAGPENDSWIRAAEVPLSVSGESASGATTGFLDSLGNSRWFRFNVRPGSRVTVELSSLPEDYDLALFTDIAQTFTDVDDVDDLNRLGAEFAPSVFSPSVFSPSVFSPSVFSPDAYAPSVFSPSVFSPSVFSPSVFSPSVFSPSVFSPSVFSPSVFSPSVFSPSVFSPSVFSPSVFSPSVFSPENFASAQTRSLIAVSASTGTGDELVVADTWSNTGEFYVRVTGKNGEFDVEDSFDLDIEIDGVDCIAVAPIAPSGGPAPDAGGYTTLILHDPARLDDSLAGNETGELTSLEANLAAYAARSEVAGKIIDLGAYPHIAALHDQADANTQCPYAENLLASAIKDIVDGYRALNPDLEFITIVGSDAQVPFFRYPDQALLGPEQNYDPPVADQTQSQSALRRNYILGQDEYGASRSLNLAAGRFPLPQLAVGRLVENAAEMNTVLTAYLATTNGVIDTPQSTLVTGYDFLADVADRVQAELVAGTSGARNDTLVTAGDISPEDPRSWTADDLRTELLDEGEDIIFLAGHFSANSALAADYSTSALTTELAASDTDLTNSIIFSGGCHSGYNIVDSDAVPLLTEPLDWAQAFAQKGATLVAGTGYQYGDTDFIEYSERLYALFARELRRGTGSVSVGAALTRAKQEYLATTPEIRGLHRKSIIISAVFGLPNLSVDMPGDRIPDTPDGSTINPSPVAAGPGSVLGLEAADLNVGFVGDLVGQIVELTNLDDDTNPIQAEYYEGPDGVVTNPAEPALPLVRVDATVAGQSLRGVGFRGGVWSEDQVVPLTGAPTTELRGVHTPFASTVNFPMRLAIPNYYGALTGVGGTGLSITPVQHRVDQIGQFEATRRTFDDLDLRLFYSDNTTTYGQNTPALSAPPTFSGVQVQRDGDDALVRTRVVGDPAAGIQSVWVTYTDGSQSAGRWVSLDLEQDPDDSTVWRGRIVDGGTVGRLDLMVQAVNGVGLVTIDDNFGAYYSVVGEVGEEPVAPAETALVLVGPSTAGHGETVAASATLTEGGSPVVGETVLFTLGGAARVGVTDSGGVASVDLPVNATPGAYSLVASFAGTSALAPSSASAPLAVASAATGIELTIEAIDGQLGVSAKLSDENGTPLLQRTVIVTLEGPAGTQQSAQITDNLGRARFGPAERNGVFNVSAEFAGDEVYDASSASGAVIVGEALIVPVDPVEIDNAVDLTVRAPGSGFGSSSVSVDWGDGEPAEALTTTTASHLYEQAGVYDIVVTLTDANGNISSVTSTPVVVFDPSAGFVTGGGRLHSPKGAVVADPEAEGRAHFGFVSKYFKWWDNPQGHTKFYFIAGDLFFWAHKYEWLVVAGDEATYRGTGKINFKGKYGFEISVIDDGRDDLFRIQIWDETDGSVVYDTALGEGATADGIEISRGNIKIHTPRYRSSKLTQRR